MSRPSKAKGFALLTAIILLAVFSLMGSVWLRYMLLENDQTARGLKSLQAQYVANAGANAAIAELARALQSGDVAALLAEPPVVEVPIYSNVVARPNGLEAVEKAPGLARITIEDENARINVNYAPTRVLSALFGVDGATARKIRTSLPRQDADEFAVGDEPAYWFTSTDELVTRGFVKARDFGPVSGDLTVHSVMGAEEAAAGYININTASQRVVQAVLGVDAERAKTVMAARPFASVAELSAAAGKPAATFNVRPDPATPDVLPKDLCFESRCFRIISAGSVSREGPAGSRQVYARGWVEAVVYFGADGEPEIRFWSETPKREG
ncbi:MAG: general secretion pathway protein GspK [Candidatus Hydrogenedentes bacterium]|nr:general secretion pathway protein GspK [Candidatus Hydrogenedentota bacterium]